jgi:acyl carrier protein
MTELHHTIRSAIAKIAPDVDVSQLAVDCDFRQAAELDSMDFLGVLALVAESTGVEVAEADYAQVATIAGLASYVAGRERAHEAPTS